MLFWSAIKKVLALAVALSVVASACSGDESADLPVPTTTAPATTEAPPTDEEQLAALAEGWHETSDQIYDGEADIARAADFITGDYLAGYEARFDQFKADGYISRPDLQGRDAIVVESVALNDAASVVICETDAGQVVAEETGEMVNDAVEVGHYRTFVKQVPPGWRFTQRETVGPNEGGTECEPN